MASNQTDILLALNEIDNSAQSKTKELKELEDLKSSLEKKLSQKASEAVKIETTLKNAQSLRNQEQEKLDQEQQKILDRRKQITSMGGAKSAKLVERELGIAKRMIETLEQSVLSAIQAEENIETKKNALIEEQSKINTQLDSMNSKFQEQSGLLISEIEKLKNARELNLKNLDERTASLYKRVETRYKGDAIAFAEAGACRSCFRSLPAQTFNQIIAGYNLIQCPGCSRILVYVPTEVPEIETKDPKKVENVQVNS